MKKIILAFDGNHFSEGALLIVLVRSALKGKRIGIPKEMIMEGSLTEAAAYFDD